MRASARSPEPDYGWQDMALDSVAACGRTIARNPVAVGGATAFLVTLFYVSANAVWYQPHAHATPLFATRDFSAYRQPVLDTARFGDRESRIIIREENPVTKTAKPAPAVVQGDPALAKVQSVLASLKLYDGAVDGLDGPRTRDALKTYQRIIGHAETGKVTPQLMAQIDGLAGNKLQPTTVSVSPDNVVPLPRPAPRKEIMTVAAPAPGAETTASIAAPSPVVEKVQAGLRSFGHDHIEIDGRMGGKTRSAIKEFQALFGLPETGEADDPLVAKMKEIGLVN